MALPANGDTYRNILQDTINQLAIRKAIVTDILIRDYLNADGTVRSLADASVGLNDDGLFSPFAQDGLLRDDLIADLGFYHLGALDEDGIEMGYDTSVDETMIAQSKRPVRFDVTSDIDSITIKALESTPLIDALRFDHELENLPDLGLAGYTITKPAETTLVERQVIAIGLDGENFFAMTYPRMSLRSRGNSNWNKADPDVMEIELGSLLCPYVGVPCLLHREGTSWRGLQGAPVFGGAPTATATSGQTATVAFAVPTSQSSAFTYVVEKSNNGTSGWTTATQTGTTGTTTVTITVSGVTTSSTWYFRVKATGTNEITTTSSNSNSIIGIS